MFHLYNPLSEIPEFMLSLSLWESLVPLPMEFFLFTEFQECSPGAVGMSIMPMALWKSNGMVRGSAIRNMGVGISLRKRR